MAKGVSIYKFLVSRLRGHHLRRYGMIRKLNNKVQTIVKSDYAMVQGSKMFLDKGDPSHLSIFGVYEPNETELVKQIVQKNQTVIDIGSSIGYYTLLCSRLVGSAYPGCRWAELGGRILRVPTSAIGTIGCCA